VFLGTVEGVSASNALLGYNSACLEGPFPSPNRCAEKYQGPARPAPNTPDQDALLAAKQQDPEPARALLVCKARWLHFFWTLAEVQI
jgi:hypothetical protein